MIIISNKENHEIFNSLTHSLFSSKGTLFPEQYKCILKFPKKFVIEIPLLNLITVYDKESKLLSFDESNKKLNEETKDKMSKIITKFYNICNNTDHYLYGNLLYESIRIASLLNFNSSSYEIILPEEFNDDHFMDTNSEKPHLFWNFKRLKEILICTCDRHLFRKGLLIFKDVEDQIDEEVLYK